MQYDLTKRYYVYPSWASFSYKWEDLPGLLHNPLDTPYTRERAPEEWFNLGYSKVTDNFILVSGPFGNGIVVKDESKITDTEKKGFWLPILVLCAEAYLTSPPTWLREKAYKNHRPVGYLSPKPTDEMRLGIEPRRDDPMPHFSLEPLSGLENSALLCVTRSGGKKLQEQLEMLPACFLAFHIKAERLASDDPDVQRCDHVRGLLKKYQLNGTWYFLDGAGYDAGLLFAIVVYLGGWLRSEIGGRLKSCHLITTLPSDYEPKCPHWNMARLR
jgi:hypothetical protein